MREINFGDLERAKIVIFAIVEALKFDFDEFWQYLKVEICQKSIFRVSKIAKRDIFILLGQQKLISRKIWVAEKCWNFHTVFWASKFLKSYLCLWKNATRKAVQLKVTKKTSDTSRPHLWYLMLSKIISGNVVVFGTLSWVMAKLVVLAIIDNPQNIT